jgi:hypothetical protein
MISVDVFWGVETNHLKGLKGFKEELSPGEGTEGLPAGPRNMPKKAISTVKTEFFEPVAHPCKVVVLDEDSNLRGIQSCFQLFLFVLPMQQFCHSTIDIIVSFPVGALIARLFKDLVAQGPERLIAKKLRMPL